MDSLFSYIIIFGLFIVFFFLLPYLFPIILILLIIALLFKWRLKKNMQTFTFSMDSDPEETSNPKNDAIDVEYTETEEDNND